MEFKNVTTANEQFLWKKLINGDDDAYSYFYKKYAKELFSYGSRFTTDRDLVKDCIQDVFVRIYKNRSRLSDVNDVRLYLFIALKNVIFNVFEKDKQFYCIDTLEPVFNAEYSIEDEIIHDELIQEQREKIKRILEVLPPRQKEAIYYRYVKGLKIKHICTIMNMNYQSVQNLLQRSIKKLHSVFVEKNQPAYKLRKGRYY
ncbi:MAG: sigma-70 family RNA polymerase sigma factor [Tannerellaceae bacterium]|jgi:RNA polymerase sigma factor (sigma-70 family)|nr:sigma-70 family RNA polymerase sigma factor [Tannerellaceae bacterium]